MTEKTYRPPGPDTVDGADGELEDFESVVLQEVAARHLKAFIFELLEDHPGMAASATLLLIEQAYVSFELNVPGKLEMAREQVTRRVDMLLENLPPREELQVVTVERRKAH